MKVRRWWGAIALLSVQAIAATSVRAGHGSDPPPPASEPRAIIGQIDDVIGHLTIRSSDGRIRRVADRGTNPLYQGDSCGTERGSLARMHVREGAHIIMNADTLVRYDLREERARGTTRILRLGVGELWLRAPAASAVEIETPVAVASLNGGEITVTVEAAGRTVLTVIAGTAEFSTAFGTCTVASATWSVSERGTRCTPPRAARPPLTPPWIAAFQNR